MTNEIYEAALELLAALHYQTMDVIPLPDQNKACAEIINQKIEGFSDPEMIMEILANALVIEVLTAQELRRKLESLGN